jgi:hypothetical protein
MIPEGGYEVEGFRPLFNFKGRFREKVQDPVIQRLTRTATQPRRGNA